MNVLRLGSVGLASAAPAGSVLGVTIDPDGWTASITLKGVGTGGSYAFGLGTDNHVSGGGADPKVIFTVVSKGFDDVGNPITVTRTVYGVKFLRKPYPNQAQADETISGPDVVIRVILSNYIYAKDKVGAGNSGTDPVVAVFDGLYTQGGTASKSFSGAVTNGSSAPYKKPVANWGWPGLRRLTVGDSKVRCCAFEGHGQQGRSVRVVKFTRRDEHGHVATQFVTAATIEPGFEDQIPVIEYVSDLSLTDMDSLDVIEDDFVVYPWVGDEVLDTRDGVNAGLTPLYTTQKNFCDKSGAYGITIAKVGPTGNDTTGTAYDSAVYNPATANKFLTIGKAASAIAAYNLANHGRNDVGGGVIELEAGNYAWLGSSNSYGGTPETWITVRPAVGVARSDVVVNSASGNVNISNCIKIENVTITTTTPNSFSGILGLWFHKVEFNTAATNLWQTTGGAVFYVTHSKLTQLGMGIRPFNASNNHAPALVRGNDLTGFTNAIQCYTVIGNKKTGKVAAVFAPLLFTDLSGQSAPATTGFIIAFNIIYGFSGPGQPQLLQIGPFTGNTHGGAVVQNIFEHCVSLGTFAIPPDISGANNPHDNFIIWHNLFLGSRMFVAYNETDSTSKNRRDWSMKNNYWDRLANKVDTYPPENGARVGAWPVVNNVGSRGNQIAQNMISLPGNFYAEFAGIDCHQPPTSSSETMGYPQFVNRQSADENNAGAGDGDYHLQNGSPLIGFAVGLVLPFDIEGTPRLDNNNACGAYCKSE
jgi:hypothetical protein